MKLILGSQSKNRQRLLRRAGLAFEVLPADIDEKAIRTDNYQELPLLVARAKADALMARGIEPALLITADTVTTFCGELREKPVDEAEARKFLETYSSDEPIQVITGLTVTNTVTGKRAEGVSVGTRTIAKLPAELIDELVADPITFTLAGGFTIFDRRIEPYVTVGEGSEDNIGGLPLDLLRKLMAEVS